MGWNYVSISTKLEHFSNNVPLKSGAGSGGCQPTQTIGKLRKYLTEKPAQEYVIFVKRGKDGWITILEKGGKFKIKILFTEPYVKLLRKETDIHVNVSVLLCEFKFFNSTWRRIKKERREVIGIHPFIFITPTICQGTGDTGISNKI